MPLLPNSPSNHSTFSASRRQFVTGLAAGGALLSLGVANGVAQPSSSLRSNHNILRGNHIRLNIDYMAANFTGKERIATVVNGSLPAPTLRWREGETVTIKVTNNLAEDSSIHWHGLILPTQMDGVPGLSFAGIKPGKSFEYQFKLKQSGTFWYHSHSGFQEPTGMYGAIIIDPKEPDPVSYDRDYVVVLSDWSDESPKDIYAKLKKQSHYYNFRERTASDTWRDIKRKGVAKTWRDRAMWNQMRMSDTDISDVNGYTYTYLMNGVTPHDGWTGEFRKGEKVRLRIINGSAMTLFDFRIPGLKMTVVATDGQNIQPVTVDEFRIGTAETYDVVVEPSIDMAYTLFAQSIDRTGYARGTLTSDPNLKADVPAMDVAPTLSHRDMGMGSDHSMHSQHDGGHKKAMNHENHSGMMVKKERHHNEHGGHTVLAPAGYGSNSAIVHVDSEFGPHVDMRSTNPQSGLADPGIGLRHHHHRYQRKVLTYADIKNLYPTLDQRQPNREIDIHLTGNMKRYMWSLNGIRFVDADPIHLTHGERVRINLINDTMMSHPMHLHGLWSELETGDPMYIPRKHTVIVQPGSKISYLVSADALGRWAYHCHLVYHMPGMFREVRVT